MLLDNSMASMTYDRAKKAAEASSLEKRYKADHPKVIAAQGGNRRARHGNSKIAASRSRRWAALAH